MSLPLEMNNGTYFDNFLTEKGSTDCSLSRHYDKVPLQKWQSYGASLSSDPCGEAVHHSSSTIMKLFVFAALVAVGKILLLIA